MNTRVIKLQPKTTRVGMREVGYAVVGSAFGAPQFAAPYPSKTLEDAGRTTTDQAFERRNKNADILSKLQEIADWFLYPPPPTSIPLQPDIAHVIGRSFGPNLVRPEIMQYGLSRPPLFAT